MERMTENPFAVREKKPGWVKPIVDYWTAEEAKKRMKYPHLRFPYEAIPEGRFKELVDKACEGGLSPGLVVPSLMALTSSLPVYERMEGARINLYVCLLAMVGAGKDTAIDRAIEVLGLGNEGAFYTEYSPNGDRAVATLLGEKPPRKGEDRPQPGFFRHCIITRELDDTLHKAKSESSSVLQIMQHLYDKSIKTFPDTKRKTIERVNCRLSWLTALPVGGDGEIDESAFSEAFGRSTGRGLLSRIVFGFSEERFDRRKSRNWKPPVQVLGVTTEIEASIFDTLDAEGEPKKGGLSPAVFKTIVTELMEANVEGFEPGVEDQYLAWEPNKDASGRDTYHVLKAALISTLLSGRRKIAQDDWEFALEFMAWQEALWQVFAASKAKDTPQAQFNETVIRQMEQATAKMVAKGKTPEECWIRWRGMSNSLKWYRHGLDVERTIDNLVKAGALVYQIEEDENGKQSTNKKYVRVP